MWCFRATGSQEIFCVAEGAILHTLLMGASGWPARLWLRQQLFLSTWLNASEVHVIVEDACGLTAEAMVNVSIDVPELIVELEDSYEVSCNVPFTITPDWSWRRALLQFRLAEGFSFLGFSQTLNWTTDADMSVTLEVSDGCGQFVTVETEVIVVSPHWK